MCLVSQLGLTSFDHSRLVFGLMNPSVSFGQECDEAYLRHMMFSMYEYGNSPDNPLYEAVQTHFTELAAKYPSTMLRVTLATETGAHKVGILPSDFVDGVLTKEHLGLILWRVKACKAFITLH